MGSQRPRPPLFRPDVARDVDDELSAHLELRRQELVAQGFSDEEARELAQRKFGNVPAIVRACCEIDERWYRGQRRARMWTDLRQDVGYAFRLLRRSPGFTAVAIVTLALGIGGSTAIFSIIDAALLRPLPYPQPEQLVQVLVERNRPDGTPSRYAPSLEDVRAWRAEAQVFSHVTKWRNIFRPVVVDGAEPERVTGLEVTEDYFAMYGVAPLIGRTFETADLRQGAEPVVMLGHAFWQRRFGGDPAIVGQVVRLDNVPATVIGVLPRSFYNRSAIWKPQQASPEAFSRRGSGGVVYARLRPGVSAEQARQRLAEITTSTDLALGQLDGIAIESLYDRETRGQRTTTDILAATVAGILFIACSNVAGLLLARGATRGPELAVRAAVGAGRPRLIRQVLVESLVLSVIGGAAGALLAWISLDALVANIPMSLPENAPPALNTRVLFFALGLSLVTGTLFGLAPAVRLSRVDLSAAVSRGGQRHGAALSRRGGQLLIAGEVAIAIILLAGAGLMIRSFVRLSVVDVGFDPDAIITMEVGPVSQDPAAFTDYYPRLLESLRHRPGVDAVGAVDHLPLAGSSTMAGGLVNGQRMSLNLRRFLPGSFDALGFTLKEGRLPTESDVTPVLAGAVVNETAAREMFPDGSPLGRTFEIGKSIYQVHGVVADVRHRGPLFPTVPEVYLPHGDASPLIVVVRPAAGAPPMLAELREAARAVGPRVVVHRIRHGSDWFADRVVTPRRRTVLLGLLGGLGFLLALVGIFGMTAYAVGRRTREIGVRMALGATPGGVVRAIVRDAMWPVTIGIVIGLAAAAFATRVIESFLFETRPIDAATFAAVAAAMAIAGLCAAWIPARRAARVEVTDALRAL